MFKRVDSSHRTANVVAIARQDLNSQIPSATTENRGGLFADITPHWSYRE
jgi:hypothetical protein